MKSYPILACTPKFLPPELELEGAQRAIAHNPTNAPRTEGLPGGVLSPTHMAMLTQKYWGSKGVNLTVQFLDSASAALRARILSHANAWGQRGNIAFHETQSQGQVRITFGAGGYWSYLGTDILSIPANQQTMNLQGFSMNTPDSEFYRVVRHEFGHTLGAPHEHLRRQLVSLLDAQKTIAYFGRTQGWDAQTVREQVLMPLEDADLTATPEADQISIMCYQISGECTKDGKPIPGGLDIDPIDQQFVAKVYPKQGGPGPVEPPSPPGPSQPLYTLTFNQPVRQGQQIRYPSPTAVPSGSKLMVFPPAQAAEAEDVPMFEELE